MKRFKIHVILKQIIEYLFSAHTSRPYNRRSFGSLFTLSARRRRCCRRRRHRRRRHGHNSKLNRYNDRIISCRVERREQDD